MKIIVIGCGRLGSELSSRLFQQGHQVTVVDENPDSFESLDPQFRGRTVEGDPFSKDVLERAGIAEADGLAVVTNSDTINAVVGHIGCCIYNIPNVVVRNYDPKMRPVLEAFGLQMVSSTSWGAQRIEEMLGGSQIATVFSAGNGEVEVYELIIPDHWTGRKLGDLLAISETCLPVALTRAGRSALPAQDMLLEAGDVVDVSTTDKGIVELRTHLFGKEA